MMIRPILAAAVAITAAMPALADDIARQDTPAITVSGEGSVSAPPDLAQIDAGVASDAKTAREAAEANNAAMAKVLQALKTAGIADKDVQTSRLSLQPQYQQNKPGQAMVTGYRASNRVTIKLHDVAKVANVIDAVVAAGANDVGNVFFSVAEPSKLLDQAREKAVADARRKAEIYAKAAGVTLGQPLNIAEDGAPIPVFRAKSFAAPMAGTPTPVAQGEETLSITVSVTWAIKAGQ
ncbi:MULTISPECIES: SIMPL domain-containing protein [unclassified Bradyrhizobium]|uniref:SIMPL domain-containing protein n=1 Tax=unclassified Bradyrhizobium TaxID=2631580 RepID=UPI0024E0B46F|nr:MULTISPECIES: SIMPL domain-containing protein [unclassified Bradyrhizobium]